MPAPVQELKILRFMYHRKGTMEHADVLYGVTMQEKGISKLISVDFSEAEKSITA